LLPGLDRPTRRRWITEGWIAVEGQVQDRADRMLPPGARVEIRMLDETVSGDGAAREHEAVWAWALGWDARTWNEGRPSSTWRAWIEATPWWAGDLASGAGDARSGQARFEVEGRASGYARLKIEGSALHAAEVLEGLARLGLPVVGDLWRGGLAVEGGPQLAADSVVLPTPGEPVWRRAHDEDAASAPEPGDEGDLRVSEETARALAAGHPWVLADEASDSACGHRPGALVRILERQGQPLAWARIEGGARLTARVWGGQAATPRALPSVEARVARALAHRRAALAADPEVEGNTVRLIHGEADGLPGLHVDRLGALLRVLVSGWASEGFRDRAVEALLRQLPVSPEGNPWSVLEVFHLRGPGARSVDRVRWAQGGLDLLRQAHPELDAEGFVVRERGLDFRVDPGWDTPRNPRPGYGLFLDQRDNRERLARRASGGGRWLNLFAHTGAFSVALLAAGAEEVVSVDLSAAYLRRLDENLLLNQERGVDPARHTNIRGEARRVLERFAPAQRFRGIVLDPPTAAAAGRRFWSVRDDLEPLLAACVARLEAGGHLLVSQNRAGPPLGLDHTIERVARRAHRAVASLEPAPPAGDHLTLQGFPEGDPFEGWLLDLA
jgi:23S rRNA (cytosine1962-C5)-methyltransferase